MESLWPSAHAGLQLQRLSLRVQVSFSDLDTSALLAEIALSQGAQPHHGSNVLRGISNSYLAIQTSQGTASVVLEHLDDDFITHTAMRQQPLETIVADPVALLLPIGGSICQA